jgi:hypothetical protein
MNSDKLSVSDVKVFVPAMDFPQSLKFYALLGWKTNFQNDSIAELELNGFRFFLQNYYVRDWANNFMLYVNVADAQAWYEHVSTILENESFNHARIRSPQKQSHGDIVTHVWDPSGVLIHFAQSMDA